MKDLIGKKVYFYSYVFNDGAGFITERNDYTEDVYEVLLQNKEYIVLSDKRFTSLRYEDFYGELMLNKSKLVVSVQSKEFGTYIDYKYYSTDIVSHKDIREDISKLMKDKFSTLSNIIDNFDEMLKEKVL